MPLPVAHSAHALASWTHRLLAHCLYKIVDPAALFQSKALRALIGMTLVMLLIVYGASAIEIILNGLSVTFILQVDNLVPAGLLSQCEVQDVQLFLNTEYKALCADVRQHTLPAAKALPQTMIGLR